MQAAGLRGDLAFALQSRTDRAIGRLNVQPLAGDQINGTIFPPPINFAGVGAGDPFTPMARSYAGDLVRVKMQAGGHEEEHNATIHGVKWLQTGSGHGKGPKSGWRNAQAGGISEQFTLTSPIVPVEGARGNSQDYAYSMDASHDGWWSGMWGILRSYETPRNDLVQLPGSRVPFVIANRQNLVGVCPITAPVRTYDVTAVLANNALAANPNVTIQDLNPSGHVGAAPAAGGGTLVYNPRTTQVGGQTVADPAGVGVLTLPTHNGPLHDPTAMLYVRTADLDASGKLTTKPEPVVIRAAAGDCIVVTLRNALPASTLDLATLSTIQGVVKRDRFLLQGSTTFNNNLFQASSYAGLHPQLVAYDVTRADGTVVGNNPAQDAVVAPGGSMTVRWYAGHIDRQVIERGATVSINLVPTAVELGAANLQPADKVKQGAKSLVGALVIEPQGSTWNDTTDDATGRQSATVTRADGSQFRDFSAVFTKALTHYYADSAPVEHINGEAVGIPEDSQEASGMAINYGIEPIWFRHGIVPQAPFGNAGAGLGTYGGIPNQFEAYSNGLAGVGGDPATPVFLAKAGQEMRVRVTNPFGTSRGTTFQLHGHVWQRDPYVCAGSKDGLAGRCATTEVGSTRIGNNPLGFAQGGQESITPATHFDVVVPSAGGGNARTGDYLFRDSGSFGNASGLWGIVRVQAQ